MAFFLAFSGHALTSQTTRNAIQGTAPYLTFDGGRTRVVDTNGLLGITLSDGTQFMPSTNPSSSSAPIVLPVAGQSFADIGMLVPTYTNSVALSSLIGPPYNYWGDDDGDTDVTATGSLSLSIVDKNNQPVTRHTVPDICKAPYQVKLTSTDGTLSTRYGVPSSRIFSASNVTYYINPQAGAVVCFARPNLRYLMIENEYHYFNHVSGPASIWNPAKGFLLQSITPSSYGLNFPTTGAHNLYFDLDIAGSNQALFWAPVSHDGITATMTSSTATGVRVTLTGPVLTKFGPNSSNFAVVGPNKPPTLPQTFELVGRDNSGKAIIKYGFVLKQWFYLSKQATTYDKASSICSDQRLRLAAVKDLTNASCNGINSHSKCQGAVGAIPSSPNNYFQRVIGAGFFSEWGSMHQYDTGFYLSDYWTSDGTMPSLIGRKSSITPTHNRKFVVNPRNGSINLFPIEYSNPTLCVSP